MKKITKGEYIEALTEDRAERTLFRRLIYPYNYFKGKVSKEEFLKLYWLDILAVFPFFLVLRLFEEVLLLSERSALTLRNLFHAGLILEEEAQIARTAEVVAKEGRVVAFARFTRPLRRLPRFFKAISFYEHPGQKKTAYH